jgi:hypothetical protein
MYRGYSRVHGTDEYFESGEICTTYILPPNIGDSNVFEIVGESIYESTNTPNVYLQCVGIFYYRSRVNHS